MTPTPTLLPAWMRAVHDNLDQWERHLQTEFRRQLRAEAVRADPESRYSHSFRADTDGWGE